MKRFFAIAASLLALSASAQISSNISSGINLIATNAFQINNSFMFQDTSGSQNYVILYDNNSSTSTNIVLPGFVGVTAYNTNVVLTWTNVFGVTQMETNLYQAWLYTTNAPTTNEAARKFQFIVPANGSFTYVFNPAKNFIYGFQLKAQGAGFINFSGRNLP